MDAEGCKALNDAKLGKKELNEIAADYGLPRISTYRELAEGEPQTQILLDTPKGKFLVSIDPTKSEMELKRELDFLLFLRKHGFPCAAPLPDRRGRYYRDLGQRSLTLFKYVDGHPVAPDDFTTGQLENVGRLLADMHLIGKGYKKGVDNRFGFERVSEIYREARGRLPQYFKRIIRTLDEELDYLHHYIESKLPKGIICGDIHPEGLRFKGDKLVVIRGIDAAARGKFIFELANAVNLLCFEDGRYTLKRFEALLGGYEGLRTLSLAEWDAFPNELRFSAFRFAATRLRDFYHATAEDRERVNQEFHTFYERLRILRRERDGGMEPLLMAMATGYDYRKYQRVKAVERTK